MPTKHLLDSDIFISAHQRHYGMDFCPAFWDWLLIANGAGCVFSIDRIYSELVALNDDLSIWAKARDSNFFLEFDDAAAGRLPQLVKWAEDRQPPFKASAKQAFSASGDLYLIAYAAAHSCTVVTHEVPAPESKKWV